MHGTFNRIPIEVFAMKISPRVTVLRVLRFPQPELEERCDWPLDSGDHVWFTTAIHSG
jgi:hypothetical protein